MPIDPDPTDREEQLTRLLAEYLTAAEAGLAPDPGEWADRHPEFRDELTEFLSLRKRLDRLTAAVPREPGGPDETVPAELGGYELIRELGRGGMGVVYAARQPGTGRMVALKVIRAGRFASAAERQRFRVEAEVAARLDHPRVVPMYQVGEADGHPFYTMKLLEGGDLRTHLPRLRANPTAAARLVADLALAVHHAHQRGVLHRDLKPSNVLLDAEGRPHVADFGLAKVEGGDPSLTRTGDLVGTLAYMAPEVTSAGGRATTAADVYSLGAVLYACLTGSPPGHRFGTAGDPTPPRRLNPTVPRDLEAVCLKCLEGVPEKRYASAAELANDLNRFLAGRPTSARPVGPIPQAWRAARRRPRMATLLLLTTTAVFALPAVVTWYSMRVNAEANARREAERDAARDRQEAATHAFYAGLERVRARRAERSPGWGAANVAEARALAAMPPAAGHLVSLRTEVAAALAAVDLGEPRVLAPGFLAYAPAYRPDGAEIALGGWFANDAGLCEVRLLDPFTGAVGRVLTYPADREWEQRYGRANTDGCRAVAYSPDGRWLVVGTRSGRLVRWDLRQPDSGPEVWRHAPPGTRPTAEHVRALAFTPSGRMLVTAGHGQAVGWDTAGGWAEVFRRGGEMTEVVRPARAGDPVHFRVVWSAAFRATEDPPGLEPAVLHEAAQAAGPGGDWTVGTFPTPDRLTLFHGSAEVSPARAFHMPGQARSDDGAILDKVVHPGGDLVAASAEHRRHLKLWSVTSGELLAARTLDGGSLRLAFAPDGRELAVTAAAGTLLFPITGGRVCEPIRVGPHPLADADQTSGGRIGVTTGMDPNQVWVARWSGDDPADTAHDPIEENRDNNRVVAISSPQGRWVAVSGSAAVTVRCRPLDRVVSRLAIRSVRDIRSDPTGRFWLVSGDGLRAWDPAGVTPPTPAHRDAEGMYDCVSPGVDAIWTGRTDGAVCRHGPAGGAPVAVYPTFPVAVTGVTHAMDGRRVVAGSVLGGVRVLDADTGATLVDLPSAHRDAVAAVAFGPGGWFVTGGRDRAVRVWTAGGEPVLTLPQTCPVRRVFVSPDGRTLTVLSEGERGLRRWDLGRLRTDLAALGLDPGLP